MKVRFSSEKEKNPTRDEGLKVLYAPGKRMAFRLRWYLILALVSAPFVWFMFKLVSGILLLETPAVLVVPTMDVRALEPGSMSELKLRPGDSVHAGQQLAKLENANLRRQLNQLDEPAQPPLDSSQTPLENHLQQLLGRAEARVKDIEKLIRTGAATLGELRAAEDIRDARAGDLISYTQSLGESVAEQRLRFRNEQERKLLEGQLQRLQVLTPVDGIVETIEVTEGENVGPGTLIATIRPAQAPELIVYLPARHGQLAQPEQTLQVRTPDGEWQQATVVSVRPQLQRLPPNLRSPFGGDEPHLVLEAEPVSPFDDQWQKDNLPLTARFPNVLQRLWQN